MVKVNLGTHNYFSSKINELSVVTRIEDDELTAAKHHMSDFIIKYDKSDYINTFTYKEHIDWWDKATRISLMVQLNSTTPVNADIINGISLWIGGEKFSLSLEEANNLLSQLEQYAYLTFNTTQKLLQMVDNATTVDELMDINIEKEYPKPLNIL